MSNHRHTHLKNCPFCNAVPEDKSTGTGGIWVEIIRCSTSSCIASFKSCDVATWNKRFAPVISAETSDELMEAWVGLEEAIRYMLGATLPYMAIAIRKLDAAKEKCAIAVEKAATAQALEA